MPLNISSGCSRGFGCNICMGSFSIYKMHCITCMSIEVCVVNCHISTYSTCILSEVISTVRMYCIMMIRPCDATGSGAAWKQESRCPNSCQHSDTDGMTRNTHMSPFLNKHVLVILVYSTTPTGSENPQYWHFWL